MYRLVLKQEDQVITERMFDSNVYSSKSKLNIKKITNEGIQELVGSLSENKLQVEYQKYNLLSYYKNQIDFYGKEKMEEVNILKNKAKKFNITLFYEDNIVISRDFFVNYFNTASRFSIELYETFKNLSERIQYEIKLQDSFSQIEDSVFRQFYRNASQESFKDMPPNERESKFNFAYSKIFSVSDPKIHE